jgi:hypothetical protein
MFSETAGVPLAALAPTRNYHLALGYCSPASFVIVAFKKIILSLAEAQKLLAILDVNLLRNAGHKRQRRLLWEGFEIINHKPCEPGRAFEVYT